MSRHSKGTGFHPVRHDRLLEEYRHDAYKSRGKPDEPTRCPGCGAVFHDGRWQWLAPPPQAHAEPCPACQRIADQFPAGYLYLSGDFLARHRDEVMHLVKRTAAAESSEHPLERIMATEAKDDGALVTTTGIHLARRLGVALHHAYRGELEFHYNEEEMLLRVHWRR